MNAPQKPSNPDPDAPDQLIEGHSYDGIKEYDNPMPGWWSWTFILTIGWSVVYVLGVHAFGFINSYEDDLEAQNARHQALVASFQESGTTFSEDAETITSLAFDAAYAERGAVHFAAQCAACHGQNGEGLIGSNLTDAYWVHGGSPMDVYTIIAEGYLPKGMPAWSAVFSAEQRAELTAFVISLRGKNLPGKAAEGDLYEGE